MIDKTVPFKSSASKEELWSMFLVRSYALVTDGNRTVFGWLDHDGDPDHLMVEQNRVALFFSYDEIIDVCVGMNTVIIIEPVRSK